MTTEKVLEVTAIYRKRLAVGVDGGYPFDLDHKFNPGEFADSMGLRKVKGMLDAIDNFIITGRREKAMRWLGFVQGILFTTGFYSISEMSDHNRMEVPS